MHQARAWLHAASRVAVLAGAGISAESGIPTFRGAGGLWRQFRPEQLATPEAFARDPVLVWQWYDWRRALIARALAFVPSGRCRARGRGRCASPPARLGLFESRAARQRQ